jgi:hypothetical protein
LALSDRQKLHQEAVVVVVVLPGLTLSGLQLLPGLTLPGSLLLLHPVLLPTVVVVVVLPGLTLPGSQLLPGLTLPGLLLLLHPIDIELKPSYFPITPQGMTQMMQLKTKSFMSFTD